MNIIVVDLAFAGLGAIAGFIVGSYAAIWALLDWWTRDRAEVIAKLDARSR